MVHLSEKESHGLVNVTCVAGGNPAPDVLIYCDEIAIASSDSKVTEEAESFGLLPTVSQTVYIPASEADGVKQCHCNVSAFNGKDDDVKVISATILPS